MNQTYKNLEIILVEDGSPDMCGRICDEIVESDIRVKVIHKSNGGLSSARNAGLEIATGDYIAFVDSDDWIAPDIYEKVISIINRYGSDVVDYGVSHMMSNEIPSMNRNCFDPIVIEGEEILYDYLYRGQTEKSPFSVCRKIYSRKLFKNVQFPLGKVNEDIVTNFKLLSKSCKLVHISDVGYYYFQGNEGSITSGILRKRDFDLIDASRELCELSKCCEDTRIYKLAKIKLARSYFSLLAKAATGGIGEDVRKKDIDYLKKNLRRNYKLLLESPMPINRKVFVTLACLNYHYIGVPYFMMRKIKEKVFNKSNSLFI